MKLPEILLLSFGLAVDACAASASRGLAAPKVRVAELVSIAACFGGFQAAMPLVGAFVGARVGPYIERWDHWIAFALLAALGAKMVHEAFKKDDDDDDEKGDTLSFAGLLVLGVATSIDALAVGVTLPTMNAPIALTVIMIGVVTALLSAVGYLLGRRFGDVFGKRLDIAGGLVLIGLGFKVLLEHGALDFTS